MSKKLSATKVAAKLEVSVLTLNRWYKWYTDPNYAKPDNMPPLPMFEQSGAHNPRWWKEEDIPALITFRDWIPRGAGGVMGDYNARLWGERGKRALKNKRLTNQQ